MTRLKVKITNEIREIKQRSNKTKCSVWCLLVRFNLIKRIECLNLRFAVFSVQYWLVIWLPMSQKGHNRSLHSIALKESCVCVCVESSEYMTMKKRSQLFLIHLIVQHVRLCGKWIFRFVYSLLMRKCVTHLANGNKALHNFAGLNCACVCVTLN